MTLLEIIRIADTAYDDNLVLDYHKHPRGNHGDGLAKFIAEELRETYCAGSTDEEQIAEACRVMETAMHDITNVVDAFSN